MIGKRFGRWLILENAKSEHYRGRELKKVLAECECGTKRIVDVRILKRGTSKSCGCLNREVLTKHGISMEKIYNVYRSMLQRCKDNNHWLYPRYGGRGITVCHEWDGYPIEFKTWALENGYSEGLTIDRIDNDKGYCPENCRFVTIKQNMNNKSNTIFLNIDGERITLRDAAEKYKIHWSVISQRVKKLKWDHKRAVTEPVRKMGRPF